MRKKYVRRIRKPTELLLVPMIDIFTVLVTFLLMTAVFSRITIVELDLPSAAGGVVSEPTFRLEVIVRNEGLEVTNGSALIATVPKVEGEYDLKTLSQLVMSLKRDYPDAENASVLLEPNIEYDYLIRVMDVVRSAEVPVADLSGTTASESGDESLGDEVEGQPEADEPPQTTRVALFTEISVGDAP